VSSAALPIVVVGGVAYALTRVDGQGSVQSGSPNYSGAAFPGQPLAGSKSAPSANGLATQPTSTAARIKATYGFTSTDRYTTWDQVTWQNVDPEFAAKAAQIEAATKKAYEDANEVAKAKAAETLNKELKLDPPLNGHEDWKTISAVVGGATGGAIGGAIGGPIGAKLGALCGAYLGVKLEELISKNLDEIEAWIGDKWGDVKEFASDVYDEVAGVVPW
jgi:hypothetical protein